jgi:hypothetical protein
VKGPLVRVALHQSRLVAPGLSLDARGVAMGPSGLVLFASVDRLVSFLATLSREGPLDDLSARIVRSKLGTRAAAIEFPLPSSDRLEALSSTAALVDAHVFTGAGRHWVEAPGPAAPFGYDLTELEPASEGFVVYHRAYVQAFTVERPLDLARLVLRLEPYPDPSAVPRGPCLLLAEWGLGGMLVSYLARSGVRARAGVILQPPETPLDDEPVRRVLVEVEDLPPRMAPLFRATPGLTTFVPVAAGAAVEAGYTHPVSLAALAAFRGPGLSLLRGRGERPIVVDTMPVLGPVEALARVRLGDTTQLDARADSAPPAMQVPLRLVPSMRPLSDVTATWIEAADLPLLRRILYAMPRAMLEGSQIAIARAGAFVRAAPGTDALPLGVPYRSLLPALYVPAGHDAVPAVSAEVLAAAVDAPAGHVVLLRAGGTPIAIAESAFVTLSRAVLAGPGWAPLGTIDLDDGLDELLPITLVVEDPGSRPLADVEEPPR